MPADYEILVERSSPIFSHSPPAAAEFLSSYTPYTPYHLGYQPPSRPRLIRRITPPPALIPIDSFVSGPLSPPLAHMAPRRSCLVVRTDESSLSSSEENDLPSPTRLKKKVVFADDKGLSLTEVRVMTEPSNVPPMLSLQFLAQVTNGISAEVAPEPWEITFPQPASNYLEFRKRLESDNVSLENVIVKESEEVIMGTVKVKNFCFDKEVFVRTTSDDWKTQEDAYCTFVDNNVTPTAAAYSLYDTFSFRLTLPPRSRRIEFCVCFRSSSGEYWDSNSGKNYVILKKPFPPLCNGDSGYNEQSADGLLKNQQLRTGNNIIASTDNGLPKKHSDALYAKLDSWSEFASWNHLENNGPYCEQQLNRADQVKNG